LRNADEFDAFYTGSVLRITAQMYPIIGSRAATEDCVQEAYARAWQRWGTVSRKADREALIRTVALRVAMYGPHRRRPAVRGEPAVDGYAPDLDADQPAVITALRQIQAADRQVVVLHYLVGEPVEQIAREVGIPAGTVRARLSRGQRGLASISEDLGPPLAEAAAEVTATIAPRPAHLIRRRGDSRHRAETLRVVAAVLVLAVIGGIAFALSAGAGP